MIVDTGSTDRTLEIARSFGVTLLEREWRHDFAWARNEGLAAATGDWILYIDADERLVLRDGVDMRAGLDDPSVFAARLHFRPMVNSTPFREFRLFRNHPRLRFKGAMHETMLPDLAVLQRELGARIIFNEAELIHLGYEAGSEWKHERNLPLLRAAIATDPDRLYYWYHLAYTLAGLGRNDEALETTREGLRRAAVHPLPPRDAVVAAMIAHIQARLLEERGEDGLPSVHEGLRHYQRHPSLRLIEGLLLVKRGRPAEALAIAEAIAAEDPTTYADDLLAHDMRVFSVYAPDLMGVALLRLGRKAEAAEAFARAARAAPDDMQYRVKAQALGARI